MGGEGTEGSLRRRKVKEERKRVGRDLARGAGGEVEQPIYKISNL